MKRKSLLILMIVMILIMASVFVMTACETREPGDTNPNNGGDTDIDNQGEHEHVFGEWELVTLPTETLEGAIKRKCTLEGCTHEESFILPKIADGNYTETIVTAPTCTADGKKTLTLKKGIVEYSFEITVPKIGHSYGEWIVDKEATCTEVGKRHKECSICHEKIEEKIAKVEHNYISKVTLPTCTEKGYTTHTCSVCGDSYIDTYVDALGHSYDSVVTAPTCTEKGYTTHTCSVCGDSYIDTYVDALEHSWSVDYQWNKDKTACTATHICANDSSHNVTATGKITTSIVDATCTATGLKTIMATFSEDWAKTQTEEITLDKLAHQYETKHDETNHWQECKVCHSKEDITAHTYADKVVEPTCTAKGYTEHTCSVCGYTFKDNYVDMLPHVALPNANYCQCGHVMDDTVFAYTLLADDTYAITSYNGTYTDIIIPATHNGKKVTSIGDGALYDNKTIINVIMQEGITTIGKYECQGCTALKSITIPASVTSIGEGMIVQCNAIDTITVADTNTNYKAEGNCLIETATNKLVAGTPNCVIPNYVTAIANMTFCEMPALTNINIPESVTTIGDYAFAYCANLEKITLPTKLKKIGEGVFTETWFAEDIVIPESVEAIGYGAFNTPITIYAEAVSKQPSWDNSWNANSTPVVWNCKNNNTADDGYIYIREGGIRYGLKDGTATVVRNLPRAIAMVDIPATVTYEGVDYSVTRLGDKAFWHWKQLSQINMPTSLRSIGKHVFSYCEALKNIDVPEGVTRIDDEAFYDCIALESLYLPTTVTSMGEYILMFCDSVVKLSLPYAPRYIGDLFNGYNSSNNTNGVPKTLTDVIIEGGDTIGDNAFRGCPSLNRVQLPQSVTSIGKNAFGDCPAMKQITLPFAPTHIGDIFDGYDSSTKVNKVPDTLEWVTISGGTTIGDNAFSGCTSLVSVSIADEVTSIGAKAFSGCTTLGLVNIPSKLTSVGAGAYDGCIKVEHVNVGSIDTWLNIDFADMYANPAFYAQQLHVNYLPLTSLVVPENIDHIGDYQFVANNGLTSVTIPSNVNSIGVSTFKMCSSLETVNINSGLTTIGEYAFNACDNVIEIGIPTSVITIGTEAFSMGRDCIIYAGAPSKPTGWNDHWTTGENPVVWGWDGYAHLYNFNTNGGDPIEAVTSTYSITLPTPRRGTDIFEGWYDNPECNGSRITTPYYYSTSKTVLHAKWRVPGAEAQPEMDKLMDIVTRSYTEREAHYGNVSLAFFELIEAGLPSPQYIVRAYFNTDYTTLTANLKDGVTINRKLADKTMTAMFANNNYPKDITWTKGKIMTANMIIGRQEFVDMGKPDLRHGSPSSRSAPHLETAYLGASISNALADNLPVEDFLYNVIEDLLLGLYQPKYIASMTMPDFASTTDRNMVIYMKDGTTATRALTEAEFATYAGYHFPARFFVAGDGEWKACTWNDVSLEAGAIKKGEIIRIKDDMSSLKSTIEQTLTLYLGEGGSDDVGFVSALNGELKNNAGLLKYIDKLTISNDSSGHLNVNIYSKYPLSDDIKDLGVKYVINIDCTLFVTPRILTNNNDTLVMS